MRKENQKEAWFCNSEPVWLVACVLLRKASGQGYECF